MVSVGACAGPGGRVYFFAAGARRVFFLLWVRPCPGLGRSGGIQWGVAGQPGGAFIFLLRVRGAFFFLLWVRGRFAHSLAAGVGLGNPIGHGLRRGLSIFLLRVRGAFFFCCGCSLARGWAGQAESNGAWPASRGARLFFCCGCAARFFFCCGCAAGSLTHLLPGWASGIQLAMVCVGACQFFCCGCAARFFLLWVLPCPGLGRSGGIQWGVGRPAGGRVYFFAAGARRVFFFAVGARQVRSLTCCRGGPRESNWAWSPYRGLCGAGGGARLFFCCGCAARFVFCCGCARGSAGQAECNGAWAGQPGGAFIFLLRVRGAFFFFAVGARQVRSLTCCRQPPSIHCRKASRVRGAFFFLLRVRELWGGAFIFLLRVRGAFIFLLRVRSLTHSLTRCPPPGEHQQQKSTHNKKKHGFQP